VSDDPATSSVTKKFVPEHSYTAALKLSLTARL